MIHLYGMRLDFPNSPAGVLFEVPAYKSYLVNQATYLVLLEDEQAQKLDVGYFKLEPICTKEQLAEEPRLFLPREGENASSKEWPWPPYLQEE